jgi:hypothetical protein
MPTMIKVRAPDGWTCVLAEEGGLFSPVQWRDVLNCVRKSHAPSPALREHPFCSPEEAMDAAYRERLNRDYLGRFREEIIDDPATLATTLDHAPPKRTSHHSFGSRAIDGELLAACLAMFETIDVKAPDGWICVVAEIRLGVYSPVRWKQPNGVPDTSPPLRSEGLRIYRFATSEAAMMAAYQERLYRGQVKREGSG